MNIWWTMLACGMVTFVIRLSFIAAEGRLTFPHWFRTLLPFVPVAALTALVIPELLMPQGALWLSLNNARLVAGVVAIAIAVQTRSVLWTLVGGFTMLALLNGGVPPLTIADSLNPHVLR